MSHRLVLAVAAAAACLASAVPAAARDHAEDKDRPSVSFVAPFHDPGAPGFTNHHLDCPDPDRGGCAYSFDGTTVETGGMSGSTTYHGWLYPGDGPGQEVAWEVAETFTGEIAGCGRGTVQWTGRGYGDLTSFDVASQSAHMWGTMTIVRGSGTKGLRGVSGSFRLEARAQAVPPAAQDGTFAGSLSCHA
jgi:hypothetical protein